MVGVYAVNRRGERKLIVDKIDEDFRHAIEFIMSETKYTETELMAKDYITFNQILSECEQRAKREAERQKAAANG